GNMTGPGGGSICDPGEQATTFIVTVPPEGVPATPGDICSVMGPVESNNAARVTLLKDPQSVSLASGQVTIAPALLPDVIGLPTIEVVRSPLPGLMQMTVSNVAPNTAGFSFDAQWPMQPLEPDQNAMMIIRTSFDLACGNQQRQV